jgi:hypothetical protein
LVCIIDQRAQKRDDTKFNTDVFFTVDDKLPIVAMSIGFMPSWWNKRYGVCFGEKYIFDPDYRVETTRFKWKAINERFPELNVGSRNPKPEFIRIDLHNAMTPAVAGCELVYPEDGYPTSIPLSLEKTEKLELPKDVENTFPYNEIIRQTNYLNRKLNTDHGPFFFKNGTLNDAVLIRGSEIFMDLMDENELAKKVMDYSYNVGIMEYDFNFKNRSMPEVMPVCNCTADLIGPVLYESGQYDYDVRLLNYLKNNKQKVMLHHCGFFDRFIPVYSKLPKADMLQIGPDSSPRLALEAFPNAHVDYCFSSVWLTKAGRGEVIDKTNQILEETRGNWNRFSVNIADIDVDMPESYLMDIYECIKKAV